MLVSDYYSWFGTGSRRHTRSRPTFGFFGVMTEADCVAEAAAARAKYLQTGSMMGTEARDAKAYAQDQMLKNGVTLYQLYHPSDQPFTPAQQALWDKFYNEEYQRLLHINADKAYDAAYAYALVKKQAQEGDAAAAAKVALDKAVGDMLETLSLAQIAKSKIMNIDDRLAIIRVEEAVYAVRAEAGVISASLLDPLRKEIASLESQRPALVQPAAEALATSQIAWTIQDAMKRGAPLPTDAEQQAMRAKIVPEEAARWVLVGQEAAVRDAMKAAGASAAEKDRLKKELEYAVARHSEAEAQALQQAIAAKAAAEAAEAERQRAEALAQSGQAEAAAEAQARQQAAAAEAAKRAASAQAAAQWVDEMARVTNVTAEQRIKTDTAANSVADAQVAKAEAIAKAAGLPSPTTKTNMAPLLIAAAGLALKLFRR